MAKEAVEFMLESLIHLARQIPQAFGDISSQMKRLEKSFRLFKALEFNEMRWTEDERMRELIRRIQNAVHSAEDISDAYVVLANDAEFFHKEFPVPPIFDAVVEEVESVVEKFQSIRGHMIDDKHEYSGMEVGDHWDEFKEPKVKEAKVVGLEYEIRRLKAYLFEETEELDVISIVGLTGLGKTTLANAIFHDPEIRNEFPTHIWVYVSKEFTRRDIFLAIVEGFTMLTDAIKSKTDDDLADFMVRHLEDERFLLVMDDLWTPEDWDKIRVALPESNRKGKVLITTRNNEVGTHANRRRSPHRLRFFTEEESFELLQFEIFGEKPFPPELRRAGQKIARSCTGHPLSIVLIGGFLVKEILYDGRERIEKWEMFSRILKENLYDTDPVKRLEKIIALCYTKLPYHLRECFLLFGMFPEDFEIPVWKLIRLWIAEGLIQPKNGVSLEETAENYLEELITRRLVKAEKFKFDGRVKTCRIHDMLRDFCIAQAGEEGLMQEITASSDAVISTESKFRCLSIHSDISNFVSRKPYYPNVRSFIYSSRNEITLPMKDIPALAKVFQLVRVLDVEPIKFIDKLPRDMFQLYHLRFLVLSVNFQVLPSNFSRLWNIQTLVFNTTSRTLEIKADLLNMKRLTHFKTNASAALPKTTENRAGTDIRTFGNIAPESCTNDVLDKFRNAKKLGVRGNIAMLLDDKNESMDSLGNLSNLEKLKLLHDVYPVPPSGAQLHGLPPPYKFPRNLKILTLSRTSLDWCHMATLASLNSLEVLKVKDKAFMGDTWEVIDGGFSSLQVLRIERTNLKIWLASDRHFPNLKHLQLKNCDHLEKVPMELAHVSSFAKLDLFHCKRAVASALRIEEMKKKSSYKQFELSIFPFGNVHASS